MSMYTVSTYSYDIDQAAHRNAGTKVFVCVYDDTGCGQLGKHAFSNILLTVIEQPLAPNQN